VEKLPVRGMTRDDLPRVCELERVAQPAPWSQALFEAELSLPHSRLTVAECYDRVAGYLCAWEVAGDLEIQNVVTDPTLRRQGVASALLEELLEYACRKGMQRLLLEVRCGNQGAIALYRRYGFTECGVRRGYYADGEDALLMERSPVEGPGDQIE